MPFPASSGLVSFSKQGLCEDTPAEHWGWLDLSCGWRRGGSTGTACCAWSFAPMASVLVLEEVPQLPLSLCCTSHSHETVTRPPCVGPVLPQVGNSGHFWDVNHLEGVWQLSELQACARSSGQRHTPGIPVGRDVGAGDAGAGGGSVLDVESVCLSVAKQKPQTSSRGFAGGAAKVRECVGAFICAGLCWGTGPLGCCFSVRAKSNFCHLPVPWFPHLCKTRRRYFSPEMLSKRWFVAGARLKNGNPGACPRVFLTVEWLQRLKCSCSPQGAGQHLALPH